MDISGHLHPHRNTKSNEFNRKQPYQLNLRVKVELRVNCTQTEGFDHDPEKNEGKCSIDPVQIA